jgi:hypothetical protein
MGNLTREFIDFWIGNPGHAPEQRGAAGAELRRCVEMASSVGLSQTALDEEAGGLSSYIGAKLAAANKLERGRPD